MVSELASARVHATAIGSRQAQDRMIGDARIVIGSVSFFFFAMMEA